MRGARLICLLPSPTSQVPGTPRRLWFAAVWRRWCVRYRLRVRCSEARQRWGRSDLGEIVLAELGDGAWGQMYRRALHDGSNCRHPPDAARQGELWLGTRSATESLECFQKAAELRTFLGMTAVLVALRYRSLCRMMLAARHVCKGGMLPKTRGQRIHAYVVG